MGKTIRTLRWLPLPLFWYRDANIIQMTKTLIRTGDNRKQCNNEAFQILQVLFLQIAVVARMASTAFISPPRKM